tara:strand:+ start:222 stop:953 length:732 start_codon:yes stop_codon:yes gene_type:complete
LKKVLLIISVVAITLTTCKKDKPISTNLTINFTQTVDGANLTSNSMIYTNVAGENYSIQTLKYLISDITLHTDDGNTLVLDEVHFIDISDMSTFSFTYDNVANNNYTSISFDIGLDTNKNKPDYYLNEDFHGIMVWPVLMGGGYHYMKLEGDYNNVLQGYGTHTGATMGNDYSFNKHFVISLSIDDNLGDVSIDINMEINNWYQTPYQIEFSTFGNGIMGNLEKQMQLQANGIADVFSVSVNQ